MFTWIPIHEEAAKHLLKFKDRNHELIDILAQMHEAQLVATPIRDRDSNGNEFQLAEIDPFTFIANFREFRDNASKESKCLTPEGVIKPKKFVKEDNFLDVAVEVN